MPLTAKGKKILSSMRAQYGAKKGKKVFYASKNKGIIKNVESMKHKKPTLGSGKRFAQLTSKLAAKGAKNPKALAAYIGRKKFGTKKMAALSKAGRKHKTTAEQFHNSFKKHKGDGRVSGIPSYKKHKKMTLAEDTAYDKKHGIKEHSAEDKVLDRLHGVKDKKHRLSQAYKKYKKTAMHSPHPGFEMMHKSTACKKR